MLLARVKWVLVSYHILIFNFLLLYYIKHFILDMEKGALGCMQEIGITESFVVKRQVLVSAAEAAEMILRVDCIIKAAPRQRVEDRGHC